jgi:hypothetical protein
MDALSCFLKKTYVSDTVVKTGVLPIQFDYFRLFFFFFKNKKYNYIN